MPCGSYQEEMKLPGSPNPVTPTKQLCNDGACHDNLDAEIPLTQFDEEEESRRKQKRTHHAYLRLTNLYSVGSLAKKGKHNSRRISSEKFSIMQNA